MSTPKCYVVMKRGLFYRPDSRGYTNDLTKAGRYTFDEAKCEISPIGYDDEDRVTMHLLSEFENHPSYQVERLQRLLEKAESANAELRAKVEGLSRDSYEYTCEKCDKPVHTCPSCNYITKGCDCGHCETGAYFQEENQ